MQFDKGTLDVFAEFDCRDGNLTGGVKPIIKDGHLVQGKPGLANVLKTALADTALTIFSDHVDGRNGVATVIPISGRVTGPDLQRWPAILGVIRNAFVLGVSESFAHLPPPTAKEPEGSVRQLVKALRKKAGPPKAQPQKAPSPVAVAK